MTRIVGIYLTLLLTACASTQDSSSSSSKGAPQDKIAGIEDFPLGAEGRLLQLSDYSAEEIVDIQHALTFRGLYWTAGQNPAFLDSHTCPIEVTAHRGHYSYPENSESAVIMAALSGYDGVEIDVMMTREGYWVLHHDSVTGRTTGRSDGKKYRMSRIKGKEWNTLRLRNKKGVLSDEFAPYAIDVFKQWANIHAPGQQLNIEIKQDADISELAKLNNMARQHLVKGSYFYSSLNLDVLKDMRELDPDIYLGYIWEPHPTSIDKLKQTVRKGVQSDSLYSKYNRQVEWISDLEGRHRHRRKSTKYPAKKMRTILGANSGLHVDIRSFVGASTIYSRSKKAGLKRVATYSINGSDYHQQQLNALHSQGRPLPDQAVMDNSKVALCSRLYPEQMNKRGDYQATTKYGKAITRLPNDADFSQLEEQLMYLADDHYLAANGRVYMLKQRHPISSSPSPSTSQPTVTAESQVFIPKDEELDLNSSPISIDVPE